MRPVRAGGHAIQIVDVDGSTNLLDALERYAGPHTIHDFRTPRGHVTTAQREVWLTSLPEILSFHLQRVRYSTAVQGGHGRAIALEHALCG